MTGRARQVQAPGQGEEVGNGDDVFGRFFACWEPQVRRYLTWLEGDASVIDDAAQETMISAHRYWKTVCGLENPRAWLFKVAVQRLGDAQTARRKLGLSTDPHLLPDQSRFVQPRDQFTVCDARTDILESVRKLPPQQARAVALQAQYDLPLDEIAAIMGISTGSVKTHLHHARKALRVLLGEDEGG
ncbi:RNA polymerase sigma factor [Streptomyces sp. NPDC058657]|uniref:RNA polymerase sigma factor n=1 Tax=unclassified Streptomyces TaxID=2593676 RepID=UPI0036580041